MGRSLSYQLKIDEESYQTEMDSTGTTIKGVSDTFEIIGTALGQKVVRETKLSGNESASTWLENSFDGSYGLNFRLDLDDDSEQALRGFHDSEVAEVIAYLTADILNLEQDELSGNAERLLSSILDIEESLKRRLRQPLKNVHAVVNRTGNVLKLYRKTPRNVGVELSRLNIDSYRYLTETRVSREQETFSVIITRFNYLTGNGRLLVDWKDETLAFRVTKSRILEEKVKTTLISQNLRDNTDIPEEERTPIEVVGRRVKLADGNTVKILIDSVSDD